jgi:tetratricopeptide (TPR) repeat protein
MSVGSFAKSILLSGAAGVAFAVLPVGAYGESSVQIQTFKTHSRLSFQLDEGAQAEWKDIKGGFELFFKGVTLGELGAPLGSEEAWTKQHDKLSDNRLKSIRFHETPAGLKIIGTWKFPVGDNAPAEPKMEHFDYRTKTPVRYVVDFWLKAGPTVLEARIARRRADQLALIKKTEETSKARHERRIAVEKARASTDDVTRFCRQPLSDETDVFLPYLPLHERVNFGRWFPTTTPDSEYIYLEPKGNARDAQYVRLALEMYRQGNPALTVRVLDFFEEEQPASIYRLEMRFLRANALIKLGLNDEALRVLREIISTDKNSGVALHSGMYIAAKFYSTDSHLAALEGFLWLIQHYPGHRMAWVFHLGAAEALYDMRETDRAAKQYQWIVENSPDKAAAADAAARMGDLYLSRFSYERALGSYAQALGNFKTETQRLPAIFLNRAETLYWIGQLDRAEEAFKDFQERFPSHSSGWRATLRLGEIAGRRAGMNEDARKWFYATINRYPFSPGATIARMRLMPCDDHGGFDLIAAEKFFSDEAAKFNGMGDLVSDRFKDLRAVTRVRTLANFGNNEAAVMAGIEELTPIRRSETRDLIGILLGKAFRKTIMNMLADGKKMEALAFYQDKVQKLPAARSFSEFTEPDYLLRLSQAAADLGLGLKAAELSELHRKEEARFEKDNRALASLPDPLDLATRVRASERAYTEAKALWMVAEKTADTKHLRDLLAIVVQESEFSYDREVMLGLLDEREGKLASALSHALKAQVLMPAAVAEGTAGDRLRLEYWISTLHVKAGSPRSAVEILQRLQKFVGAAGQVKVVERASLLGLPPLPTVEQLVMIEGDVLSGLGRWGEAASAFGRIVERGEGGNHAKYRYADALDKTGERVRAVEQYQQIVAGKTDDFWKKLAGEALAVDKSTDVVKAKEGGK